MSSHVEKLNALTDSEVSRIFNRAMANVISSDAVPSANESKLRAIVCDIKRKMQMQERRLPSTRRAGLRRSRCMNCRTSFMPNAVEIICALVVRGVTFGRKLAELVTTRCNGHASRCYRRAGVSRQVYSQIISKAGSRPSKRIVMQLAVGLRLNRLEADEFLSAAGYAFSPTSYEDQVFAHCLECGIYNMLDVNELLVACNCTPVDIN